METGSIVRQEKEERLNGGSNDIRPEKEKRRNGLFVDATPRVLRNESVFVRITSIDRHCGGGKAS